MSDQERYVVVDVPDKMTVYDAREKFLKNGGGTADEFVTYLKGQKIKVVTSFTMATEMRTDHWDYPTMVLIKSL